jgi:putative transposase
MKTSDSIGSYSFYSTDINTDKYKAFYQKALQIRNYKNCLSQHIISNLLEYLEKSKVDLYKEFGNSSTKLPAPIDLIYSTELQKAVGDVYTCYQNKFAAIQSKLKFNVQKSLDVTHYKRKTKKNKVGDVKTIEITKKSTNLTKVMSYLSKFGFPGCTEYIRKKLEKGEFEAKKIEFHLSVLNALEKFGEERLLKLALMKRENVFKKYNSAIEFKSLSYRSSIVTDDPLIQADKNSFKDAYFVISCLYPRETLKQNPELKGKTIIPIKTHSKHHGKISDYQSKEYTVCIEDKRIRFITTKKVERSYADDKESFLGVDVNLKHNLFACSNKKNIDFDRTIFKKFCHFIRTIDSKKNKDIELSTGELRLFALWQRRIQTMLKTKCSELVDLAIAKGKDHIVMEDLKLFGRRYAKSDEFQGIKFSRFSRLLNLSNLKNIVASICEKKGVQLTIIPSHYTSQLCNACGHISRENRKSQERFVCEVCGDHRNADFNASINIALIGEHEVHDPWLIKQDSIGWFSPVFKTKYQIADRLENIVLKKAFQRSRLQLVPA